MSDGEVVVAEEPKYKVASDFKATVKLFSGKEVVIDLMKVKTKDWKRITRGAVTDEEEYDILTKVTGLSAEDLLEMQQPDYRLLIEKFVEVGTQPLKNPT